MIKVSVIIPVYNVEEYLEECLDSVINQTLQEIEIICVNDGSTDDSLVLLEKYAQQDDRIQLITKENAGQGAARNVGVNIAQGEYLSFVDSDDYISLDAYETLYNIAKKDDLDILQGLFVSVKNGEYTQNIFHNFSEDMYAKVFNGYDFIESTVEISSSNCDKLWNRDFFISNKLYNDEGVYYEDLLTAVKGVIASSRIMVIPFTFYYYRQRSGSTMNQKLTEKHYEGTELLVGGLWNILDTDNAARNVLLRFFLLSVFFNLYGLPLKLPSRFKYLKKSVWQWLTKDEKRHLSKKERMKFFLPVFVGRLMVVVKKILQKRISQ